MAVLKVKSGSEWVPVAGPQEPIPSSETVARAWVIFRPAATVLLDHYNVTSVDYVKAGQYTVNFERPMPDANYASLATADVLSPTTNAMIAITRQDLTTITGVGVICTRGDAGVNAMADPLSVKAIVFRND